MWTLADGDHVLAVVEEDRETEVRKVKAIQAAVDQGFVQVQDEGFALAGSCLEGRV